MVDRFDARNAGRGSRVGVSDGQKWRHGFEGRKNRCVVHVFAAAAMARLASDPDFQKIGAREVVARRVDRPTKKSIRRFTCGDACP
jgi:hypothetical protein